MKRGTVLVVDDHTPTRAAYAIFFEECGYAVLQAAHGGEAILHVYRNSPDVVVLDVSMPVLDGLETAESLRRHGATAKTPIIGITGCDSHRRMERMLSLCDAVFLKPCDPVRVELSVRSLVEAAA